MGIVDETMICGEIPCSIGERKWYDKLIGNDEELRNIFMIHYDECGCVSMALNRTGAYVNSQMHEEDVSWMFFELSAEMRCGKDRSAVKEKVEEICKKPLPDIILGDMYEVMDKADGEIHRFMMELEEEYKKDPNVNFKRLTKRARRVTRGVKAIA